MILSLVLIMIRGASVIKKMEEMREEMAENMPPRFAEAEGKPLEPQQSTNSIGMKLALIPAGKFLDGLAEG